MLFFFLPKKETNLAVPFKLNMQLPYHRASVFLGIYPRETKTFCSHEYLYMNVYSSSIHNTPNRWLVKQSVLHSHPGILLSIGQEPTIGTHQPDKSAGYYAEWKKPILTVAYSRIPFTWHFWNGKIFWIYFLIEV